MTPLRAIGVVAAVAAAVWIVWRVAGAVYLAPRAELRGQIAAVQARIERARDAGDKAPRLEARLQSYVDRTLGGDSETADHGLRTRLNRIAEAVGLDAASVGTGSASPQRSPARGALPRGGAWRAMRDEVDLVELDGWISGTGPFETVVALVDRIEAEPWLKRIDRVRVDPKDGGARFAVNVRLTTLFLPGRTPVDPPDDAYDPARLARYAPIVAANPFRLPPPVAPPAVSPPPGPPPFPWGQWALTGVAEGPDGAEAWVRNRADGAVRRLAPGDALGAAVFVGAAGEWAEFREQDEHFRIRIGGNLDHRTAVRE